MKRIITISIGLIVLLVTIIKLSPNQNSMIVEQKNYKAISVVLQSKEHQKSEKIINKKPSKKELRKELKKALKNQRPEYKKHRGLGIMFIFLALITLLLSFWGAAAIGLSAWASQGSKTDAGALPVIILGFLGFGLFIFLAVKQFKKARKLKNE